MNKDRLQKLESLSHELLSQIIFEETSELFAEYGLVQLTRVEISPDLSYLDAWVSALKNGETLTKTLAKKNYSIQGRYNRAIAIRKLPKIRYRYDKSGERSAKILDTLHAIHETSETEKK